MVLRRLEDADDLRELARSARIHRCLLTLLADGALPGARNRNRTMALMVDWYYPEPTLADKWFR